MEMTLSMQHYGRGVANIPMPRALSRGPRKEWPVSPSLIIFILAVLLILLLKLTTTSTQKLLKPAKTIIVIPQTQPAPEPTVPKSIPLIKVLKDAVKKTVEPKKKELKKIVPKKEEPKKKPLPQKIKPKEIKPLARLDKKIEPKQINRDQIKPKPLAKEKIIAKPETHKKLDVARPLNTKIPENKIMPKPREFTPGPMARTEPLIAENAAPARFTAMPDIKRKSLASVPSGQSAPRLQVKLDTAGNGPAPELTQWKAHTPDVTSNPSATSGRRITHNVKAPVVPAPVHHVAPAVSKGPAAEDLVIINSSSIGNSDRVKTLKRDIMKKAGKMDPAHSPYQYKIKHYTCTLAVEGGEQGKIIIDFTPADAPFDVVSALERLLPR